MKPEQFIREFGVEKAREVVEGAPDKTASHYAQGKWGDAYYSLEFVSVWSNEEKDWFDSDYATEEELNRDYMVVVDLSNLKRLVESLDIVMAIGPIEYTRSVVTNAPADAIGYDTMHEGYFYENNKHYYENLRTFTIDQIKEAIAVHESIYGGGDETN
ncbi:hypothetical protein OW684_01730 [Acinetobacter baumannii]|uniref:hypothetical protein n=1 Tax=Acinetobacter baumannii TaxID=470 RepID=UPI0024DEAA32|nr:hypothetical protein [Acinetobacter baumannii]MDK2105133.1 hypothetical protein [Acinetobacter baumannii]MDK2110469.1 hypothetical protein [Acinetobacter baumannii]MDK2139979.1 hypothetical protein [Acinetobacter baumannii]MDK2150849.1 hypothetical protein [Acinetobacter baumannii]MDK2154587.1 hypothetical protein [Acinetobacter baumannii]